YRALQTEVKRKLIAEEMRVLYVAMTRAKEKLVLTGNINSLEKIVEKWHSAIEEDNWLLPIHERKSAKSYLDWIGQSLIRHKDKDILRMTSEAETINKVVLLYLINYTYEFVYIIKIDIDNNIINYYIIIMYNNNKV